MKKALLLFISPVILVALLLTFTSSDFLIVPGGKNVTATYVGSDACSGCHSTHYNDWVVSGHPYKFTVIENGQPPVFPPESINFQDSWMDSLADGSHTWDDIAGVIGGYGWKSRFVGTDGHVIGTPGSSFSTAGYGHNQFNFYGGEEHGWVDYHATSETIYNYGCFKCHTTGADTTGTWLDGVDGLGTFTESGIGCEACHGPGSEHIAAPSSANIDLVYEHAHLDNSIGGLQIGDDVQTPNANSDDATFLCGTCHNRSYTDPINAGGGFIKHHEQWDEFVASDHYEAGFDCLTCHDPHKRVIWDGDGITKTCGTCHADQVQTVNHDGGATCLDCHMPYAAKSGTTRGESGFVGDVRSHLLRIIPDTASMFTADGSAVKDDDEREAALSPAYSCLGCHNDDPGDLIPDKTLEQAAMGAVNMHDPSYISQYKNIISMGVYPNPSRGASNIHFVLSKSEMVSIEIFNTSGQLVYTLKHQPMLAGEQLIQWDASSFEAGYYFIQLTAGNQVSVQKLILMK
ncbi:MAG: T9SS type A sorting domain-containing protein [Bacteroidota bacterium]